MKAYVLKEIGQLTLCEVEKPVVTKGNVVVKVEAAGICGSDIPRIYRTGAHVHPIIPGHEFAGTVTEFFDTDGEKWLNKRVGVFPLIPCRNCIPCRREQFEMCRNYQYLGSRCDGGFAEYVLVPEKNLIELPEEVSFAAAAMLEPMAVAVHAMRRSGVGKIREKTVYYLSDDRENIRSNRESDAVVVYGAGTIGLLLVMFLQEAGVGKLLVIGNKDFQRECVEKLGLEASNFCDTRHAEPKQWITEKTQGRGAGNLFECVGKPETINDCVEMASPGAKILMLGNPSSDILFEKQTYWKILRNQLEIIGTWNSSFTGKTEDDWHYVLEKLKTGRIMPEALISHRLPSGELERGLKIMRDKTEDYAKIMVFF